MGLSKLFKGIGRAVKKIGRGIKKVVKKVGRFVGKIAEPFKKLGWVGQIGLMFLMPHAAGWIWKGLLKMAPGALAGSSLAGAKFGLAGLETLGAAMTSPTANIFQKMIGRAVQGIHAGGVAFRSVTQAIGSGIDRVINTGRELFGSDTGLVTQGIDNIKLDMINPNTNEVTSRTWAQWKESGEHLDYWVKDVDEAGNVFGTYSKRAISPKHSIKVQTPIFGSPEHLKDVADTVHATRYGVSKEGILAGDPPTNILDPTGALATEEPSIGTQLTSAGVSPAKQGLQQAVTNWASPDGTSSYTPLVGPLDMNNRAVFEEVDFMEQANGHYYSGMAHQANLNEAWNDPVDIAYWRTMRSNVAPPISQAPTA